MNGRSPRLLLSVSAVCGAALVCATQAASDPSEKVAIRVTPGLSVADEPVGFRVSGLDADERVSVRVRSTDAKGITWVSSASFKADSRGRLDLAHARAVGGSYRGVWGMGLVATMHPTRTPAANAYFWGNTRRFTVIVRANGQTLASAVFRRRFSARPVHVLDTTLERDGFVGYFQTTSILGRYPAVLVLGGSEGGAAGYLLAGYLAARGYPALALAYFKEPGLPQTLSKIPLEYFAKALRWLRQQPHVDPKRVAVVGVSRGSEAALLLGVHYPDLIHGVVAAVPANVAVCSYPDCDDPAWTLDGKPVPFTRQFNQPHPEDDPAAVIPVERINGQIFLDCAGMDTVWDSCLYATAITQRLHARHFAFPYTLYRYPKAGHHVGIFVPYEPTVLDTTQADEQAREDQWPQLLRFLSRL